MFLRTMMNALIFAAFAVSSAASPKTKDDFARYPTPVLNVHAPPAPRDPTSRYYRTVFREAMKDGVNFAGHMTLVIAGCGAGCVNGWFVDRRNGRVVKVPITGEEFPVLRYQTKPTSRLLRAEWFTGDWPGAGYGCIQQDFLLERGGFRTLNRPHKARCELEDHK